MPDSGVVGRPVRRGAAGVNNFSGEKPCGAPCGTLSSAISFLETVRFAGLVLQQRKGCAEGLSQVCGECGNFLKIFLAPRSSGIFRPQPFSHWESPFFQSSAGHPTVPSGARKKTKKSFRKVLTGQHGLSFMEVFLASENGAAFFESYSVRLGGSFEPVNPLNNNCATAFCRGTRDLKVTHSSQSELGR